MTLHIGYTYIIKFIPTGQFYYGSRCAKECHPSEFWVTYFTSSKLIKEMINEHGKESFNYEIRKQFQDIPKLAQQWERKVLNKINAGHRQDFLNKSNGVAPTLSGWKNPFFGKKHSPETLDKIKKAQPDKHGANNPNWRGGLTAIRRTKKFKTEKERQEAQSEMMKNNNPMNDPENRKKISEKAKLRKNIRCSHCNKLFNPGGYVVHINALKRKGIIQ